ncbi:RNase H domain-containing protein [Trichonephila clavipes]|nr:RNase H domain-containing protein [Trichonephila clavipes]
MEAYGASTPQDQDSNPGLARVNSAFHSCGVSIDEFQACLGTKHWGFHVRLAILPEHMFVRLSTQGPGNRIHLQWILSHVDIAGNEIADSLAKAGAGETTTPAAPFPYLELFSKYKARNKTIWMAPPVHPWYQSKFPGGF